MPKVRFGVSLSQRTCLLTTAGAHHLILCRILSSFISFPFLWNPLFSRRKDDSMTESVRRNMHGLYPFHREIDTAKLTTCQYDIILLQCFHIVQPIRPMENVNLKANISIDANRAWLSRETYLEPGRKLLNLVPPLKDRNCGS